MPDVADRNPLTLAPLDASGFYTAGDDNIRLTVYNSLASVVVVVAGRFRHLDGRVEPFEHRITPTSNRVASVITQRLGEGWLLSAHCYVASGAPLVGQTFAIVSVVRGFSGGVTELATLAAGYVTAAQRLAYPGTNVGTTVDGAGAVRTITGTNPGAGAEISETVPTGARWQLLTFRATFTASAAVANRNLFLQFDDGTTLLGQFPQFATVTASGSANAYWISGYGSIIGALQGGHLQGMGGSMLLAAGYRIRTLTSGIDVADAWTSIRYSVREWIEGAS